MVLSKYFDAQSDHRSEPRFKLKKVIEMIAITDNNHQLNGNIDNISIDGLCIHLSDSNFKDFLDEKVIKIMFYDNILHDQLIELDVDQKYSAQQSTVRGLFIRPQKLKHIYETFAGVLSMNGDSIRLS